MENTIKCSYWVKKNNRNCLLKAHNKYIIDDKLYCKKHYDSIKFGGKTSEKNNNEKKQCEKILKNNKQCKLFSLNSINGVYYCKRHFSITTNNEPSDDTAGENVSIKCEYDKCSQKYVNEYCSKKYCKKHYDIILNEEKKEITNMIDKLSKLKISSANNITASKIKKDGFKILLRIHPDKCKNPKIDSHSMTQKVNSILEKYK